MNKGVWGATGCQTHPPVSSNCYSSVTWAYEKGASSVRNVKRQFLKNTCKSKVISYEGANRFAPPNFHYFWISDIQSVSCGKHLVPETELWENGWSLLHPFCIAASSSERPKGSHCLTLLSLLLHTEILWSYSRAWHVPSLPPWGPTGLLALQQHILGWSRAVPPLQPAWQQPFWASVGVTATFVDPYKGWSKIWLRMVPPCSYSLETWFQQGSLWDAMMIASRTAVSALAESVGKALPQSCLRSQAMTLRCPRGTEGVKAYCRANKLLPSDTAS